MQKIIIYLDNYFDFNSNYLSYQTRAKYFKAIGKPYFIYHVNGMVTPYPYQKITPEVADASLIDPFYNTRIYDTFTDYGDRFVHNLESYISKDSKQVRQFLHERNVRIDPKLINLIDPNIDHCATIIQVPDGMDWKVYRCYESDEIIEMVQSPHYTFDENGGMEDDGM